jgi:lipid-binding SYLF domain-containing protein
MQNSKRFLVAAWLVIAGALISNPSFATTAVEIDSNVDAALASLYQQNPKAKELGDTAKAVLVFPKIIKGGFIVGV